MPATLSPLASEFNPSANELAFAISGAETVLEKFMPVENFAKHAAEMCGLNKEIVNSKSAMETAALDAVNDKMENLKSAMKSIHEEMETSRRERRDAEGTSLIEDDVFESEEMCDDDIDEDAYEDKDEDHSILAQAVAQETFCF